jgi:hypothetical protein
MSAAERRLGALLRDEATRLGVRPQSGGATSHTTPAWTVIAASQASSPGNALFCMISLAKTGRGSGRCSSGLSDAPPSAACSRPVQHRADGSAGSRAAN